MKKLSIILCILLSLFLLTACEEEKTENSLDSVLKENNYIIVDVRTEEDYNTSHIKGAINIPYDTIDENTELDKEKTILVYCKSGTRSGIAKETLEKLGYEVINLGAFDSITLEKE